MKSLALEKVSEPTDTGISLAIESSSRLRYHRDLLFAQCLFKRSSTSFKYPNAFHFARASPTTAALCHSGDLPKELLLISCASSRIYGEERSGHICSDFSRCWLD